MPPPRPPPRRPPRAQAQYAAHALQQHGALPPRPPPADPAVTTAIEVLEASARYAESQIDVRSRDAAVDAALGACARALSRGEVPLVAPAAQAAARVAQLASGAPNTLPRLAQLVDQLVGWALDVSMERRDARALTDNLARFGLNCWRSERVVAQTLVRNLDQDLSRLASSARDETQVIQVASVARCLSAVLRNLERDASHAQTCSRFVDALLSARTAAQEPHAWDDVCHELCIDLLKGSDFRLIEQPYGRCLEQQLTAVTTHALDAVGADSSKSSAKHARRCGRAAGRVAAWLSVQGPLSGGGASEILGACLDSTPSSVSTAFRDCRRSLVIQDANKEPYTTLFEARKKLAKALAALATLARQPERVARAASISTDADDYAFFLDAALRDVDGSARLCEAAPQNNNRDNWDAWCRTASSVAKGAAQPARSRGAGAAARREALEKALQALCSAPSFEGECFQALTALCDALPHGAGVKALETREALATKALPSLIKRLRRRPVSNKDLNHAGPAFAACASRLASGDDQYVDSAATASLQVITSLGGGGDGSVACIRGLGRPKAEGDRDATLQLVSRAQESSSGDLAALFVEDTTDDTQPLEVAVIDLEEHVTPALKTRHERDGDARACLLALLRPQTRVSVSKSTTPHKKGKRPPALLLRRPGTPPPDTDDDDDSAAHRARAAAPSAFAKTAATQIVSQLLRSCLGDPAQTLERISNDAKEAAMRGDRAQRVNILALVDALEREMGRVAETRPSTLPDDVQVLLGNNESDGEEEDNRPPWEVAFFFRQNRKVCDAWLSQIRKDAAVCALRSGSFAQASYHAAHDCSACALQLKEVRAKVTQSKKTPKAEIDAIRRFEDALAVLALARTALGDGAGVRGLHRWHRDVADSSDGKRRGWWLEAAADVAAGRHAAALTTIAQRSLSDDCRAAAVTTALELAARSRAALGRRDDDAFRAILERRKNLEKQSNKTLLAAFEGKQAALALGRWTAPHVMCRGDPVDLSVRKAVSADTQTRLALTDICAKLRDAKPADGPFGRYARSLSVAARAATAAATNFPGPCYGRGDALRRLRRATDAGWARPVIGVAQAFSDNVQRTQRAVEACELEAAASVCCRRNDDRDAAEDYLASLTARAALVREHGSRHWRLVDGAPLHVLVERCHLTKPGTFRALKNAARLVEHACLLREQAGPPTLRTLTVLTEQDSPKLPLKRFLEPDRIVGAPVDVASDKLHFSARWLRKACRKALKVTTNIDWDAALTEAAQRCCLATGALSSNNGPVDLLRACVRATPADAKSWLELGRWTESSLNDVDEARHAYARCLQVGGLSAKLASIAGARLIQASEDAKGLDELADDTPTNAWVSVAPQLLGAAFTPSSTYSPTRPWFRLLRRVALERPEVVAHAVVVACREAKRDKAALLEDGTTKPWFRGGAATRTLRAELALSGATTRALLAGSELLADELHTVATLPEDRWCIALSRRTCAELRDAQHSLRRELARSLVVFTSNDTTPVPDSLNKDRLEELIDSVLFKRKCLARPFLRLLDKAVDDLIQDKDHNTDHAQEFHHVARAAVAAARESLESPPRSVVREWCRGDRITGVDGFGGAIDAFAKLRGDDIQQWSPESVAPRLTQGLSSEEQVSLPVACTPKARLLSLTGSVRALASRTRPKKIHVACDDGLTRAFLLKGREDVHLDARVMQLLQCVGWATKASINRYAVLPLSRSSGLIEWVPRTTPLFTLYERCQKNRRLTKAIGIRQKRLSDEASNNNKKKRSPRKPKGEEIERDAAPSHLWRLALSRRNIDPSKRNEWDLSKVRSAYDELAADAPSELVDRALARAQSSCSDYVRARRIYAESLGTSCVVAHALGLGDRHLDNVLLDASSAKLWDVDWGVCFDAGHRLRVPEKVPFRLTPCVARPLGPEGAARSGVFVESAHRLASSLAGDAGQSLAELLALCCRDARVEWRATRGPARIKNKERDEGAKQRGVLALASARLWEDRRSLRADALKRSEAVKACLDARYASIDASRLKDEPEEEDVQRPKQAELAHATKETKRLLAQKREAERSRADASDAVYNSKMALDEALSRSATERQRRIDARFKLSTGDDTLATLAATLRAAAAGAVGVPEPNLELLRRIFETRPDLRDVVAALRDDNLLSDGIRAARDQVLQNGSMFAFQGYENTNEKEDMRVLETIHAALLRTPPDPRPACRDAATALERASEALRSAAPLVAADESTEDENGDAFAHATSLEEFLGEAEARLALARDLVEGSAAPLRSDRIAYALQVLDTAKDNARSRVRDQINDDAFVGALKSLRRALDATDALQSMSQRPVVSASARCQRSVSRLRDVDSSSNNDDALVDAACQARAALDDSDVRDASCLHEDDRSIRIAARLDSLRDAAVGLDQLLDQYDTSQDILHHIARGCDAAKRLSRDAARLFAASALSRPSDDKARAWRARAFHAADDSDKWRACLSSVREEAPDDDLLIQALDALWAPLAGALRACNAEDEGIGHARRGLLAARDLTGDDAERSAGCALSEAASAGAAPLEKLLLKEIEAFASKLPATASRSDAAVLLSASCAAAQLKHLLMEPTELNMILQHLQRRWSRFDQACDSYTSRRGAEVVKAAHQIQARSPTGFEGAALNALRRASDRISLGEAARSSLHAARQTLETGLRALDSAQPFGALGLLDELQPRVPRGDGSWEQRLNKRRDAVLTVRRWVAEAINACDVVSGLPDLGGVINGDNVNDLQDALKHAQQYFDAGARIGDAADAAYAAAQAHLASLRERERKATASKGALGNAARKVRFAKKKLRERQAGHGRVWNVLRGRTADLGALFTSDSVAAAEAKDLEARFWELDRADQQSAKLIITEGESVVLAVEDLEAFEKGSKSSTTTLPFHRQRVDTITREFGEKASQLVESAAPSELDVKPLKATDRTSVATLVARLLRLADRGTSQGLALDDNIQRDLKRAPPLSSPETDEETDKPASPRPTVSREGAAEDALETTRAKLASYGDEAAVDDLVKTATDPAVLCRMYEGWAPWV